MRCAYEFGFFRVLFSFQARATTGEDHYLINPFGLLYSEVTASSLVKVDKDGNVIDGGSTCLGVNKAGLVIHSTIHCARKNVKCVIHLHQQAATAVSLPQPLLFFFIFPHFSGERNKTVPMRTLCSVPRPVSLGCCGLGEPNKSAYSQYSVVCSFWLAARWMFDSKLMNLHGVVWTCRMCQTNHEQERFTKVGSPSVARQCNRRNLTCWQAWSISVEFVSRIAPIPR